MTHRKFLLIKYASQFNFAVYALHANTLTVVNNFYVYEMQQWVIDLKLMDFVFDHLFVQWSQLNYRPFTFPTSRCAINHVLHWSRKCWEKYVTGQTQHVTHLITFYEYTAMHCPNNNCCFQIQVLWALVHVQGVTNLK